MRRAVLLVLFIVFEFYSRCASDGAGCAAAGRRRPALHHRVLLQVPVGPSGRNSWNSSSRTTTRCLRRS